MKDFDWNECQRQHSIPHVDFLRLYQDILFTEDEFVDELSKIPKFRNGKLVNRTPSRMRREYRSLKTKFGFFGGNE